MTNDELQHAAAVAASEMKAKDETIEGVFAIALCQDGMMGAAIIAPSGDIDRMIACVVQTLGALRHNTSAEPPAARADDDSTIEMKPS